MPFTRICTGYICYMVKLIVLMSALFGLFVSFDCVCLPHCNVLIVWLLRNLKETDWFPQSCWFSNRLDVCIVICTLTTKIINQDFDLYGCAWSAFTFLSLFHLHLFTFMILGPWTTEVFFFLFFLIQRMSGPSHWYNAVMTHVEDFSRWSVDYSRNRIHEAQKTSCHHQCLFQCAALFPLL